MKNRVQRDGLGYRLDIPAAGVAIRADRLREASGEVTVELTVERAPDGHLSRSRFNLLSGPRTRAEMANGLSRKSAWDGWAATLEELSLGILELEREGSPWLKVGKQPPRDKPPYLLRPWLFEMAPTILFGGGGLGKSTVFAAGIVVTIATGRAPMDGWAPMRTGPVLILDWEGDDEDWNDAISLVAAGMGIESPEVLYRQCRGPLEGQVDAIAEMAQEVGAVLIVVDSAEAAMRSPRDAGADDPAKRFYDALRMIPTAALVIDHVSKSTLEHGGNGGPIGSVTKYNRARAVWELRQSGKADADGTRHLALINRKMSKDAVQDPVGVAVRRADGMIRMWQEPYDAAEAVRQGKAARLTMALWERIHGLLASGNPMTAPEIVGALSVSGKDPLRIVESAMSRQKLVFAHGTGGRLDRLWYVIEGAVPEVDGQIIAFPGAVDVSLTGQDDPDREHTASMLADARHAHDRVDFMQSAYSDVPSTGQTGPSDADPDQDPSEPPPIEATLQSHAHYSTVASPEGLPFYAECIGNHSLTDCPDPAHHPGDDNTGPLRGGGLGGEVNSRAASEDDGGLALLAKGAEPPGRSTQGSSSLVGSQALGSAHVAFARDPDLYDPFGSEPLH